MNRVIPMRPATYQDILDAPEGMIAQIINGALYTQPRPSTPHALALTALSSEVFKPFHAGVGGPGGWTILNEPELHLEQKEIYVPDIAGWRNETMPELEIGPHIKTAPDWVCEVLSPSTRMYDLTEKRATYAMHGVGHLWFVDPDAQTLEAFALQGGNWMLLGAWRDKALIHVDPFADVKIQLDLLWPKLKNEGTTSGRTPDR